MTFFVKKNNTNNNNSEKFLKILKDKVKQIYFSRLYWLRSSYMFVDKMQDDISILLENNGGITTEVNDDSDVSAADEVRFSNLVSVYEANSAKDLLRYIQQDLIRAFNHMAKIISQTADAITVFDGLFGCDYIHSDFGPSQGFGELVYRLIAYTDARINSNTLDITSTRKLGKYLENALAYCEDNIDDTNPNSSKNVTWKILTQKIKKLQQCLPDQKIQISEPYQPYL